MGSVEAGLQIIAHKVCQPWKPHFNQFSTPAPITFSSCHPASFWICICQWLGKKKKQNYFSLSSLHYLWGHWFTFFIGFPRISIEGSRSVHCETYKIPWRFKMMVVTQLKYPPEQWVSDSSVLGSVILTHIKWKHVSSFSFL